jgi:copper(I)-binding protein
MMLVNEGREAERLVRAHTEVTEVAEIHETRMEGEVMKMQLLPDGIEIPAGGEVELKPGGYHIMLIGLKRDLNEGDRFTLVLEFEKSGRLTVEVPVRQP